MKNKKGFTLVELLAVIVILALIMSIAVVSISGILDSSKYNTFKETGLSVISAVRQQLMINNEQKTGTSYYYFQESILEKGGKESPFGGEISYTKLDSTSGKWEFTDAKKGDVVQIGTSGVYRAVGSSSTTTGIGRCGATSRSYVKVVCTDTNCTYTLCLTAGSGKKYINNATEAELMGSSNDKIAG